MSSGSFVVLRPLGCMCVAGGGGGGGRAGGGGCARQYFEICPIHIPGL